MARAPKPSADLTETKPRPTDDAGRQLDGHGLPLSGPARIRALNGRPDPARRAADPVAPPAEPATPEEQN